MFKGDCEIKQNIVIIFFLIIFYSSFLQFEEEICYYKTSTIYNSNVISCLIKMQNNAEMSYLKEEKINKNNSFLDINREK